MFGVVVRPCGGAVGIHSRRTVRVVGTGGPFVACGHRHAASGAPHADRCLALGRLRLVAARHVSLAVRLPLPVPARSSAGRQLTGSRRPARGQLGGGQLGESRCADAWPDPTGVPRRSTGASGSG